MIAATPSTFVIGAGPVATALAGALRLGGVPVLGLWGRRPAAARTAGAIAGVAAFSAAPPDLMLEADVILVAVRDAALAEVAAMLVNTGLVTRKHVMLHCSGALSAEEAFAGVAPQIGGMGTLHPLRAVVDARAAMRALSGTVFGVQGDEAGRRAALALLKALGGQPLELVGAQMAAYHAAAALASNGLVALLAAAAQLLARAGIAREQGLAALLPLCEGTLANLHASGLPGGLTGPIRRGDRATVGRHLAALVDLPPEVGDLYRLLGRQALALARELGEAPADDLDAIEGLLAGAVSNSVVESRAGRL